MSSGPGKKGRGNRNQLRGGGEENNGYSAQEIAVFKAEAKGIIKDFIKSGALHTALPPMSREQRKIMHDVAQNNGLVTRSTGKEPDRYIVLSLREKRLTRSSLVTTNPISPSEQCCSTLSQFLADNPITEKEMNDFLTEKSAKQFQSKKEPCKKQQGIPPVPHCSKEIQKTKDLLPASKYRHQVLQSIAKNDVVIISGGTGCGKTTQVPQFILEEATEKNKDVRIMVTQPRRIAAISISERVSKERGEGLGDTVGYQIRLESRTSHKTLLTYCTTGVLLRMLTSDPTASGITHIIMDEIHEREINTDYLLIALRECLKKRKDLKIILMSATIEGNMQLFSKYFENQSIDVIRIEARTFDVKIFYIDQVLAMSGYQPPESQSFFSATTFKPEEWGEELKAIQEEQNSELKNKNDILQNETNTGITAPSTNDSTVTLLSSMSHSTISVPQNNGCANVTVNQCDNENHPNGEITSANEWSSGVYNTQNGEVIEEETMMQFMRSVGCPEIRPMLTVEFHPNSRDSVFVNGVRYTTDKNQSPGILQQQILDRAMMPEFPLVYLCNAPSSKKAPQMELPSFPAEMQSSNWQPPVSILPSEEVSDKAITPSTSGLSKFSTQDFGGFGEKQRLSNLLEQKFRSELKSAIPDRTVYYHPSMDDRVQSVNFEKLRFAEKYDMFYGSDYENSIDHNLLNHVIKYLADSPVFGTILVFLPGFDDIQLTMGMIDKWKHQLKNMDSVLVIPLHSQMQSINHWDIFKPVSQGVRKIILATNIAEASITIEDVIFVVDTGKVKEKWYDHEAKLSTLAVKSIARSNAEQRSGRAGRVAKGYCIRLYSEKTFDTMAETQVAEMKRAAIYDVTLHAKLFAPDNMRIAEFLALAPEPPDEKSIIQSIDFLEQVGAFYRSDRNSNESLPEGECGENKEHTDPELTDMGRLMARLPLDPQLSRMLLFGLTLKCLAPIVNLVSLLASREPYVLAQLDERERQAKMKFLMAEQDYSDHLMYIRLCTAFCAKSSTKEQNDFCREHLLNPNTMRMVNGTRRQLLKELSRAKVIAVPEKDVMQLLSDPTYNAHSNSWTMVQAAIAAGCYPSVGVSSTDSNLKKVQTFNDRAATLHPSSMLKKQIGKLSKNTLNRPQLEYVVFQEMCLMSSDKSLSMKTVTAIPALTALLFTGPIRMSRQIIEEYRIVSKGEEDHEPQEKTSGFGSDLSSLNLDDWYSVKASLKTMKQCLRLRHKLMQFFLNGIAKPKYFGIGTTPSQKRMLEVICELLDEAHSSHNFSRVDMPITVGRSYSHKNIPNEESNREEFGRRKKTDSDTSFSESRAVNHRGRGQWNRKNHSYSTHPRTSNPDSLVLNNVPYPTNFYRNMNYGTSNPPNIGMLADNHILESGTKEQSVSHHNPSRPMNTQFHQGNRSFHEYGYRNQGNFQNVMSPAEDMRMHQSFSQLSQKSTTSMGGFSFRGVHGGNSRMPHFNGRGRGGANSTFDNHRTN